jgi:hypothetical protein
VISFLEFVKSETGGVLLLREGITWAEMTKGGSQAALRLIGV